MPRGMLGKKVGMTQVYGEDGTSIPVTVIELGPCVVLQVRTPDKDGYSAVQLGFGDKPQRLARRSELGHVGSIGSKREKTLGAASMAPKANCEPKRFVREFRTEDVQLTYEVGQVLTADALEGIAFVDVVGKNKGRGFAGAMRRHNFHGLCSSHGVKKVHRSQGSTGMRQDPGRVFKGQKMPGHWGDERITVRRLKVVRIDKENNMMLVRGAIPGYNGAYVMVRETNCY